MNHRIPTPIHDMLNDFQHQLATALPGLVNGLYLHGSLALNTFDPAQSDIDFIAFVTRPLTDTDAVKLRVIHQTIAQRHPRWLLEGSYLQWADLGQLDDNVGRGPIHHDNRFEANSVFDRNSVTWWVLKQRGIALLGPAPSDLPLEVDWGLLVHRMRENLNSYWASYLHDPRRIVSLLTDNGIEWTVLGVLRQYYTFVAHDITSKVGAGDYALKHLPAHWHMVIREAIRIRRRHPKPLYPSKVARAAAAYNFLRYIIQDCNSLPL